MLYLRENVVFSNLKNVLHRSRALKSKYSETILLPKTRFPLNISGGKRTEKEKEIQRICEFSSLYSWQRRNTNKPDFVLHDGPPYANGLPHMGHAINKILKDVTIRYKLLRGYRIHYVPGWDCHGLPIELKAVTSEDQKVKSQLEIRHKAQAFAAAAAAEQKKVFERWGIMADWNNCYYTNDKEYEVTEIEAFFKLYQKKLVFRDFKPVYWSPSTKTALAEAELEYHPEHLSTSMYVKFKVKRRPDVLLPFPDFPTYVLIWTTTPWTLPANECIAYSEKIQYSVVRCKQSENMFIIASELVSNLEEILSTEIEKLDNFPGKALKGTTYIHPLRNEELRLLPGHHVTREKGTGLVHCSPAHGFDDYVLGMKHGLPVKNLLDEDGCFTTECNNEKLIGKSVLKDANETVIELMGENVVVQQDYQHSYPYDWRSKQPVIIKPSLQWFLNTEKLKERTLECLSNVEVFPRVLAKNMITQLNKRPHWCISRQRVWGVPIPVFYEKSSGNIILNESLISHWKTLIKSHGSDMWWTHSNSELLPPELLAESNLSTESEYVKGTDILDIWFDSGISWNHVLKDVNLTSDLCLEGSDQSRGWFQSSLTTSVALDGRAPYKKLFFHGFALDHHGKKMSKSLGNVVDPQVIVDGGESSTGFGADVLRWWVMKHAADGSNVLVKNSHFQECAVTVQKIRSVLRFLLGNLNGFDIGEDEVEIEKMDSLDRYILHSLVELQENVMECYDSFHYYSAISLITYFVSSHISALYLHAVKHRLYCTEESSVRRRSCQTCLHHVFVNVIYAIAPVLPHLAEEALFHHPVFGNGERLVFRGDWPECPNYWFNKVIHSNMKPVLQLRDELHKELMTISAKSTDMDVIFQGHQRLMSCFKCLQTDDVSNHSNLCEIFQGARAILREENHMPNDIIHQLETTLETPDGEQFPFKLTLTKTKRYLCDRCRRNSCSSKDIDICMECFEVIGKQWE